MAHAASKHVNDNGSVDYVVGLDKPYDVPGAYDPLPATAVLRWYNHTTRDWVVSYCDGNRRQIGGSTYVYSLNDALDVVEDLIEGATR